MMSDAEITDRATDIYSADVKRRERFENGQEAVPGQPFVSRAPLSTERIREIANEIRKRQGLAPLPEMP